MDHSQQMSDSGNFFNTSHSRSEDSNSIIGLALQPNARILLQGGVRQSETLTIDFQLLKRQPVLFNEAAKLFERRSVDSEFRKLCAEYKEAREQMEMSGACSEGEKKAEGSEEMLKALLEQEELQTKINQLLEKMQKQSTQWGLIKTQNDQSRQLLPFFNQFIREMSQSQQYDPFASVTHPAYTTLLHSVSQPYPNTLTEPPKEPQDPAQHDAPPTSEQQLSRMIRFNTFRITQRQEEMRKLEEIEGQFRELIKFEEDRILEIRGRIKQSRVDRGESIEEVEGEDGKVSLRMNVVGELVGKVVEELSVEKDLQARVGRPLTEMLAELAQLQTQNQSLVSELQFQSKIKSEKVNKCCLLQKRLSQFNLQHQKLKTSFNPSNPITDEISTQQDDNVNYQQFLLKTYEQRELKTKSEMLEEDNAFRRMNTAEDVLKKAKKIVVGERTVEWTQRLWPGIKNYKQLVNWIIVAVILVLVFGFVRKVMIKNDLWPTEVFDFDVPLEETVVHTHQSKPKPTIPSGQPINNSKSDQVPITNQETPDRKFDFSQQESLEQKRKHMEEVNARNAFKNSDNFERQSDWKDQIKMEFV